MDFGPFGREDLDFEFLEGEASHQAALTIKRVEDEAKLEAERRARGILAVCMQRLAAGQSIEGNTYSIHLPSEDMKGRIIGKQGRIAQAMRTLIRVKAAKAGIKARLEIL